MDVRLLLFCVVLMPMFTTLAKCGGTLSCRGSGPTLHSNLAIHCIMTIKLLYLHHRPNSARARLSTTLYGTSRFDGGP